MNGARQPISFFSKFGMFHYEVVTSSFPVGLGCEAGLFWSRNRCVRFFSFRFIFSVQRVLALCHFIFFGGFLLVVFCLAFCLDDDRNLLAGGIAVVRSGCGVGLCVLD